MQNIHYPSNTCEWDSPPCEKGGYNSCRNPLSSSNTCEWGSPPCEQGHTCWLTVIYWRVSNSNSKFHLFIYFFFCFFLVGVFAATDSYKISNQYVTSKHTSKLGGCPRVVCYRCLACASVCSSSRALLLFSLTLLLLVICFLSSSGRCPPSFFFSLFRRLPHVYVAALETLYHCLTVI